MKKVFFFTILFFGALAGATELTASGLKQSSVTYAELRPRLLLVAKANIDRVDLYPEYTYPNSKVPPQLNLTQYGQGDVKEKQLYRVVYVNSYTAYTSLTDPSAAESSPNVYSLRIQGLNERREPVGPVIELGTKTAANSKVEEFEQIPDILSRNETLVAQRAQIGDHVINAFPTILNGRSIPAYSTFEVVGISRERVPFTLSYDYELRLKKDKDNSGRLFSLRSLGQDHLQEWALIVAPQNERIIKFWKMEIHY